LAQEAANKGDTIVLTAGMVAPVGGVPPKLKRLTVFKRLIVKSDRDFELSDKLMEPSAEDYVIQVIAGGEGTDLRVKVRVTAVRLPSGQGVPRSAGGIFLQVDSDVLVGSKVEGPGKEHNFTRPDVAAPMPIGIRVNRGTGSKTMRVMGSSGAPVLVTGFATGIFIDNPSFHVTSYVRAEKNHIGMRQRWGRGQNFYGVWKNNDVAIEMQAVHHNDTNGHTFECNGVALKSSQTAEQNPITRMRVNGPHLEYNFHIVRTRPCDGDDGAIANGDDVVIQVGADPRNPNSWTTDQTQDPGAYIQYSTRKVDGVLIPTWKTGEPD
jgi:hypothetical protein